MSTYKNGEIPDRLLIRRGNLRLTAGTWAKFDDLVARVKARTGVTLRITDVVDGIKGVGAYRDRVPMQRAIKAYYTRIGKPGQAAAEGTSSHGGEYKGADALAIDITNYGQIPLSVFFEEGRAAGFQPGYFDGKNGRPSEPWHLIDRDPYRSVPGPAGGASTTNPAQPEEEDDDMAKNFGFIYRGSDKREYLLIGNTVSGFQTEISSGPGKSVAQDQRESMKTTYDTPPMRVGSEGEAKNIKASLAAVRAR